MSDLLSLTCLKHSAVSVFVGYEFPAHFATPFMSFRKLISAMLDYEFRALARIIIFIQ